MPKMKRGDNVISISWNMIELTIIKKHCPTNMFPNTWFRREFLLKYKDDYIELSSLEDWEEEIRKNSRTMIEVNRDKIERDKADMKRKQEKQDLKRRDIELREKNLANREAKREESKDKESLEIPSEPSFESWLIDTTNMTLSTFKLSSVEERNGLIRQYQEKLGENND